MIHQRFMSWFRSTGVRVAGLGGRVRLKPTYCKDLPSLGLSEPFDRLN